MRNDCSIKEFAVIMGVEAVTVYHWIHRGRMPTAFRDEKDCWRIPIDAERPTKVYLKKEKTLNPGFTEIELAARKSLLTEKDEEIKGLRAELADLNKRHIAHLEKYAGLLGKYDKILLEWEIAKEDAEAFGRKYDEIKSQYDQLVLTTSGLTLHEEGLCHVQKIVSNSIPNTDSTPQSRRVSGVGRRRAR